MSAEGGVGEGDAVEFLGLTHECNDPECHVAGFVKTLRTVTIDRHGTRHERTAMGGCTCGWTPAPNPSAGWGDWASHIGTVRATSPAPTTPTATDDGAHGEGL